MKKTFAVLIALLACLALCACGSQPNENAPNETTPNENEFLCLEDWQDTVDGRGTLSFNEDGTGTYFSHDTNWLLENGIVEVTYTASNFNGVSYVDEEEKIQFQVTQDGEDIRLVVDDASTVAIYVPVSKHDKMCPIIRQELTQQATLLDLTDLNRAIEDNKAKAKQDYEGKLVKVDIHAINIDTGSITYMYSYNGYTRTLIVYLPQDVLATLQKNQEITVVGVLGNVTFGPALFDAFVANE